MATEQNQFGTLLRQAREKAGLSREHLAQRARLDTSYVYRIETGARRPGRDVVLTFTDSLKIEGEELNRWLEAAGHAAMPLLTTVRDQARHRPLRTRGRHSARQTDTTEQAGWNTAQWADWLEAMGLTEAGIRRLLRAFETVPPDQRHDIASAISLTINRLTETLESPVHTAVIPVAGGQHQILAAHVMQRLLLRSISEAVESGLSRIILVLAPGMAPSLFAPLRDALGMMLAPSIQLSYVEQATPLGLGDAILHTESLIGQEPFAVLLPDDVVSVRTGRSLYARELRRMLEAFAQTDNGHIVAVADAPKSRMLQYGVVKVSAKEIVPGLTTITGMVEKPQASHAIFRAARTSGIVGRYLLRPEIFAALRVLQQQGQRPLHLTTALEHLRQTGHNIYACELKATRQDLGEILDQAGDLIGLYADVSGT